MTGLSLLCVAVELELYHSSRRIVQSSRVSERGESFKSRVEYANRKLDSITARTKTTSLIAIRHYRALPYRVRKSSNSSHRFCYDECVTRTEAQASFIYEEWKLHHVEGPCAFTGSYMFLRRILERLL